jgi:hypothetical protein
MKAALLAIALSAAAAAAPIGAAQAYTGVAIRVDAPGFGIRIGTPLPVYGPPLPVPAPAYAPPAPVVYAPPMPVYPGPHTVIVGPPLFYPYGYAPAARHWKHGYRGPRPGVVPVAYSYVGRY